MKRTLILLLFTLLVVSSFAEKIIILSDIHVTPGNACDQKLSEAVAEINATDCDAVVVCGDLSNQGSDEELTHVKTIIDKIRHPLYVIPGNHENNWSQSATKTFIDLWGNDRFVGEISDNIIIVGTNCGPYMKMGDGHIKKEDMHWLKETLDKYKNSEKKIVSFNHYPLLQNDLDLGYKAYTRLLEQYPTIVHINGHYHRYTPYFAGSIPAMMVGALDQRDGKYGYSILDIDSNSIHICKKTIGEDPQVMKSYPITMPKPSTAMQKVDSIPSQAKLVWSDSASIFTRLCFTEKNIIFGNSLGDVKAIDRKMGTLKWNIHTNASLFSRSQYHGGIVTVPTADHRILFVNDDDGETVTQFESDGPYVADGLIEDGILYQGGYKKFEKYDISEQKLLWRFKDINNYCQAAPVVDGNDIIFGAWDTNLRCIDKNTGKLRWKWNNGKAANLLGPGNVVPVVTENRVFIVAPDRFMTAIDRKTGETIWRNNDYKYRESLGTNSNHTKIYAKTMDGELAIVDATSEEFSLIKVVNLNLGYEHAPCITAEQNGRIYLGSRRGIITAVDANTYNIVYQIEIGSSEVNGIDIDPYTGDVYVSLIEGTIFRLE